MRTFIKEISALAEKVPPANQFPHFREAHQITSSAIIRELKRKKIGKAQIRAAEEILRRIRFDENGRVPLHQAEAFLIGLNVKEAGHEKIFARIEQAALKISGILYRKKVMWDVSRNPPINIHAQMQNIRAVLERKEPDLPEIVENSPLSLADKQRLLDYYHAGAK